MSAQESAHVGGRAPERLRRWILAALGVVCVALGAVGVVLPGLPTTVFLLMASFLFTKSCPWLEDRLIRNRFFAPYLRYLDGSRAMPRRAKVTAIALMWLMVSLSALTLTRGEAGLWWIAALFAAAAVLGTTVILRWGGRSTRFVQPAEGERMTEKTEQS
ncbi:MAG: YbaN family protein [Planctomycetota bacterium]|nr:YbaN family protein [Planctomycetota bacterium]